MLKSVFIDKMRYGSKSYSETSYIRFIIYFINYAFKRCDRSAERIARYSREVQTKPQFAQGTRAHATSDMNDVHLYLIGEQQRSENYTNCSPWWLNEVGGETLGTRSRGAGSRTAGGHRSCDSAPAKSSDEQSRARTCIQVIMSIYYTANKNF